MDTKESNVLESGEIVFVLVDGEYATGILLDSEEANEGRYNVLLFGKGNTVARKDQLSLFSTNSEIYKQQKEKDPKFDVRPNVRTALSYLHNKQISPPKTPGNPPKNDSDSSPVVPESPESEIESREVFLDKLYKFMARKGQPINKLPSLGYQELDLFKLYNLVIARGGMDKVTRNQEWKAVYQDLGLGVMSTSASYNTRTNYKKFLYLYELDNFTPLIEDAPNNFMFRVNQYVRIESPLIEGAVFYANILKKRFLGVNQYYVHYNGWSNSHDEWIPESAMKELTEEESVNPSELPNPPPSRSSKSNHIVYDPLIVEKHYHPKHKRSPSKRSKSNSPVKKSKYAEESDTDSDSFLDLIEYSREASPPRRIKPNSRTSTPVKIPKPLPSKPIEHRPKINQFNVHTYPFAQREQESFHGVPLIAPDIRKLSEKKPARTKVEVVISKVENGSRVDVNFIDDRSLSDIQESVKLLQSTVSRLEEKEEEILNKIGQ